MKTCLICKQSKETLFFGKRTRSKDGLNYYCKECNSKRHKAHRKTAVGKAARARAANRKRIRITVALQEIKISKGCADCGFNSNAVALQFDHEGIEKPKYWGKWATGWSMVNAVKAAEKCVVRCANCHMIRHSKQDGAWHGNKKQS